ncbi:MAG: phenylalanine--tRNA ligase subunit beta, partial [Clostridia bacterium]
MNVSLNWLKEYVDLDKNIKIKEIVDSLTMSGSKVEKYEEFGKKTQNVITAKVVDKKPHEEDDKLSILSLDIGNKVLIAVGKIPDIEIGNIVPVALPGAKVIGKEIKVSTVKGINSECMVCHILDLGLDQNFPWVKPSGLLVFPSDVEIGQDINKILGLGDYIIEFEITPNRPDCLSTEGIAHELALTFNKSCKPLGQFIKPDFNTVSSVSSVSVKVETDNCKRYIMNVAEDVVVKESPYDMQLKLIKSGIRPINNIVDITNYVMLEVGQPLHAFDFGKMESNEIIVRQARPCESIITLDGIDRKLDETNMVITDGKNPIAVAGVMGGELSGISKQTKKVVIESANFVRASVRNTSKKLVLRTDASSRYEKGLPQDLTIYAMNRVCNLLNSTNSAKIGKNIVDICKEPQATTKIEIDYDKINKIIGTNISNIEIDRVLSLTGIKINDGVATIPYTRIDINIMEDLAEEVARIYGYDMLPSRLPKTDLTFGEKTPSQKMEDSIKQVAIASGFNEIYTYTFFSKDILLRMGVGKDSKLIDCVKVANPLSQEFEYMRSTTMPLMLEALERNYTKKNNEVKLFELGKVFLDSQKILKNELCTEQQVLTFGMYDSVSNFYDIKQVIENILNHYKILENEYEISRIINRPEYHCGMSGQITINGDIIAEFGKLSPKQRLNYILPDNTYIASIYFSNVLKYSKNEIKFIELPKFPAVERDIAFVINDEILSYDIEKQLKR